VEGAKFETVLHIYQLYNKIFTLHPMIIEL